jgi:hypothetical protein
MHLKVSSDSATDQLEMALDILSLKEYTVELFPIDLLAVQVTTARRAVTTGTNDTVSMLTADYHTTSDFGQAVASDSTELSLANFPISQDYARRGIIACI